MNVALRAAAAPETLSTAVELAIRQGPAFLSVVAYWEVMIKSMKGSLEVGDPRVWFRQTLDSLALQPLVLRPSHISNLHGIPPLHQDPFDRILIAQAIAEDLTLLTTDSTIPKYEVAGFRCLV